ncbi:unnamed protein product, partial [Rotaria sp. Silwood2]
TPKRPASDDLTELLDDTPRRKLIKTNQHKENNTTSSITNELELALVPSMNNEEGDQEFSPLTQQTQKISTFDDDLARKVEQCFRDHTKEQQTDAEIMQIDESNQTNNQHNNRRKSSTRRRSRFRFSFSTNHNSSEQEEEDEINSKRKSRLFRTHSASIINHENENNIDSSRRRKSYSTTGLANELKNIPNNNNNNNNEQTTNVDKKSTKTKSSLANRVKRAFFRPHRSPVTSS